MDKITSFTIDHLKLLPGVYVSRKDRVGDQVITTFDIRMTRPNYEPVMNTAGCRTGFYLLLAGDLTSEEIVPLMKGLFTFMRDYKDEVPGACAKDCGNYLDMNLPMANWLADRFLREVLDGIGPERLVYPE